MTWNEVELNLVKMWWGGTFALGWRGHIAKWLLRPVIFEESKTLIKMGADLIPSPHSN